MANIPKLEAVMDQILTNPKQHDQSAWAQRSKRKPDCGTSYCFAGWAVTMAGYDMVWEEYHFSDLAFYCKLPGATDWVYIEQVAQDVLGLTKVEADRLFSESNTVEMLEQMVKNLANGADIGEGLPEFEDDTVA